ncbi:uncharacterized protein [Panulirus ornatus]|uniref:uncharacterized protein isoform X2 n=1 Tax=Panulirus ornatus TaxID=150431 RepID=UPI003A8C481F
MMAVQVGMEYSNLSELLEAISTYEHENTIKLYRRDTRSIEAASRRCTKKTYNPDIKYTEIDFACIHGGRKFKTKSKGSRPNTREIQTD